MRASSNEALLRTVNLNVDDYCDIIALVTTSKCNLDLNLTGEDNEQ